MLKNTDKEKLLEDIKEELATVFRKRKPTSADVGKVLLYDFLYRGVTLKTDLLKQEDFTKLLKKLSDESLREIGFYFRLVDNLREVKDYVGCRVNSFYFEIATLSAEVQKNISNCLVQDYLSKNNKAITDEEFSQQAVSLFKFTDPADFIMPSYYETIKEIGNDIKYCLAYDCLIEVIKNFLDLPLLEKNKFEDDIEILLNGIKGFNYELEYYISGLEGSPFYDRCKEYYTPIETDRFYLENSSLNNFIKAISSICQEKKDTALNLQHFVGALVYGL